MSLKTLIKMCIFYFCSITSPLFFHKNLKDNEPKENNVQKRIDADFFMADY